MKRALFLLLLASCNSDQQKAQPLPPVTTEAGVPVPAAPTRTVGHRNPFGDVLQADNLMVDGDFELTGRTDQAPWVVYNQQQQTLNYDTGGRCRSGIRCALIGVGDQLVGWFVTPALDDIYVRVYVQPDNGRCADVTVTTVDLSSINTGSSVSPKTQSPDADGWCMFEGTGPNLAYGEPALFIALAQNAKATSARVDQAIVLPAKEAPVHGIMTMKPAPADVIARANVVAAWWRSHRKFGRSAPPVTP